MAVYVYRARDRNGEVLRDRAEGPSVPAVVAGLRRQGLLVIEVREQGVARGRLADAFRRVSSEDLVVFTRQLSTMIRGGFPIVRALNALADESDGRRLDGVISAVGAEVESGASLSEALGKHEDVFPALYTEMVRAGEAGGVLDDVLSRLAAQLEGDQELRRKVRSALAYPFTVLVLAGLSAFFMLAFVVPVFARMFADLGGTLPLPTRVAMGLSGLLTGPGGIFVAVGMAGAAVGLIRWRRTQRGREAWGRITLKIPFKVGRVVQKVALARFARTFAALSSAGVPILQAIEITARASGNPVVEEALMKSRDAVRAGAPIHRTLETEAVFPSMVTRMIAVGEETGDLDAMLSRIADFYESEVDATVRALTAIIEPLMVVVVGAIVGGIIIAMYLPMFRIFELIG